MYKKLFLIAFVAINVMAVSAQKEKSFYDFKLNNLSGKEVSMNDFKGKVVLVVNTASKCGLTPQYEGLEDLYKKYSDQGLVILGFPCNQFMGQEPGTAEDIAAFCTTKFGVTFPMFEKIEVNGENAHPLYKYLKAQLPIEGKNEIRWNFEKFLIDKTGKPVMRYSPKTKPAELVTEIESLLK